MAARTYVAVDLETTGLEAGRDRITEVGMVRFTLEGVQRSYSSLVNPEIPIPFRIARLTGISDGDVRDAPRFGSIRLDVEEFLGDAVVVGQNVGFDLAFLAEEGIVPAGPAYDTLALVSLLQPRRRDRRLAALAEGYGIEAPVAHRALADAETARRVFLALYEEARELPAELLRELIALGDDGDGSPVALLREIARERGPASTAPPSVAPPSSVARSRPAPPVPLLRPADGSLEQAAAAPSAVEAPRVGEVLRPPPLPSRPPLVEAVAEDDRPLAERALAVLAAGRRHEELFGAFEERPEQVGMTRAVARAMAEGRHLVVEAGTGTGKSLAYLIPAALQALESGRRVVVSTNTINLQEQLVGKDVPALRALLRDVVGEEAADALRVSPLKGRRNYLCLRRLAHERAGGGQAGVDARLLGRILVWLRETESGDRTELRLSPEEEAAWPHYSAEGEDCLSSRSNPYVRDGSCFLLRARKAAEAAHIVIVNHALLLSDLAAGGSVLPASDTTVIDEAHHLEESATQHLGAAVSLASFSELLDRVQRPGPRGRDAGIVAAVAAGPAPDGGVDASAQAELLRLTGPLPAAVAAAREALLALFTGLRRFTDDSAEDRFAGEQRLRLTPAQRAQPDWSGVEIQWETAFARLREVEANVAELQERLEESDTEAHESLAGDCGSFREALAERTELCGDLLTQNDADTIVWLRTLRRSDVATVQAAPLRVDALLSEGLFDAKRSVVLTGATLAVAGRFDYLRERVGAAESDEERFGSPFDFRRAVRLLLPTDMPAPSERGYQESMEETLVELVQASDGRALVLFTSHGALRATANGIRGPLEQAGILVLAQGPDGSPGRVIAALQENPRAVVLGTASLWEGVDMPGPTVSLLVIARLPFAVPSDPVYAARAELYDEPFMQYAVPQAIVRFRQGFGRLIRRRDDRGVVAVLDGRITSKGYGGAFVRSLPPVAIARLALHEFGAATAEWLQR